MSHWQKAIAGLFQQHAASAQEEVGEAPILYHGRMDWDEAELEDYEYPDEPDNDGDEDGYITCEECGADVYEDAPSCPACGHYLMASTRTALPTMWKWVAILILVVFGLSVLASL